MLVNKLLKNVRKLNVQKTFLCLSSWKPKPDIYENSKDGRSFCSSLTSKSKPKTVWKAIRKKSKGEKNCTSLGHLKVNEKFITDKKQIANLLASTISYNSSSQHYSTQFQAIKKQKEKEKKKEKKKKKTVKFTSVSTEDYNRPFSLLELKQALQKSNDSAVGPDDIHYKLLINLPESSLPLLLTIFNSIWESGIFPPSWRKVIIVAILKSGRDSSDPNKYRSITLTSCLCKTMERMVNKRLMWVLESKGLLASEQCDYRKNRSTADQLVQFDRIIRNAFTKKRTRSCHFLWLGKSLRHHMETRYTVRSLRSWYSRPFAYLHWWVSVLLAVSVPLCPIRMSRRWVFLMEAFCLLFFSALKLTILSSLSWKVWKRHYSWMILPFVYVQSSSHMHRDLCNCM